MQGAARRQLKGAVGKGQDSARAWAGDRGDRNGGQDGARYQAGDTGRRQASESDGGQASDSAWASARGEGRVGDKARPETGLGVRMVPGDRLVTGMGTGDSDRARAGDRGGAGPVTGMGPVR